MLQQPEVPDKKSNVSLSWSLLLHLLSHSQKTHLNRLDPFRLLFYTVFLLLLLLLRLLLLLVPTFFVFPLPNEPRDGDDN
jgi:hypothetical protein